jgi:hypothetical protein
MGDELYGMVDHLIDRVSQLGDLLYNRTTTNVAGTFKDMTPQQWIRLVIIVGAYCLLRPYVIKHSAKYQARKMEERNKKEAEEAEISPNDLRGDGRQAQDSDDDDNDSAAQTSAADWGKKARRRQRQMIKNLLDAEERRLQELQEDEEDKDIEEFLVE